MRAAVYRGAEGILEALREAMISPMVAALVVVGVDWAEMGERSPWRAASMKDEARCWAVGRSEVLVEMEVRTPWIWRRIHHGEVGEGDRCQRR